MKRFYKDAGFSESDGGYALSLDGRPVKTPGRRALVLPTEALAEAVAQEWREQGEIIDPVSMVMTGFANAAIDYVKPAREAFAAPIAAYAETDMLCYRAETGSPQADRQDRDWEPLLKWAEAYYGISFIRIEGIIHHAQPKETLSKISDAVLSYDDFTLAAMNPLTTISGSIVCVLALLEGHMDAEQLWPLVNLEELWQVEQWGEDAEAREARERQRIQFMAADSFRKLASE